MTPRKSSGGYQESTRAAAEAKAEGERKSGSGFLMALIAAYMAGWQLAAKLVGIHAKAEDLLPAAINLFFQHNDCQYEVREKSRKCAIPGCSCVHGH